MKGTSDFVYLLYIDFNALCLCFTSLSHTFLCSDVINQIFVDVAVCSKILFLVCVGKRKIFY